MNTKIPGPIPDHIKSNFEVIQAAAAAGHLAVVSAIRVVDGLNVSLLVAIHKDEEGMFCVTPFAEMIDGNPYEMYEDPTKDDEDEAPH